MTMPSIMSGSHPYFQFVGNERRYPYDWHGGAGGVMQSGITQSRVGGEARSLGNADMIESGLTPYSIPFPVLRRTRLHNPRTRSTWTTNPEHPWAIGDWPLLRPAGPEPMDPHEGTYAVSGLGFLDSLSDNEKTLAMIAVAGGVAWWLWRRSKKGRRRNPVRGRYTVSSSSRGVSGSISFVRKSDAESYAAGLRRDGRRATVRRR